MERQREIPDQTARATRARSLRRRYGITPEDFERMLTVQAGLCAICGCDPATKYTAKWHRVLHVDHNHETGEVRGLLCHKCNTYLEWFEEHHLKMLNYLSIPINERASSS